MVKIEGGFFLVARKIFDSEIMDKPGAWFTVWIYILSLANWRDTSRMKRGTCFASISQIAHNARVTYGQAEKCIKWLKSSMQISTRKSTRGMFITVINYDAYQNADSYGIDTKIDNSVDIDSIQNRHYNRKKERKKEEDMCSLPLAPTATGNNGHHKGSNGRFIKPQLHEVRAYISDNSLTVDASRFMDYYESVGWKVGKNPMKCWKSAVRTWSNRPGSTNVQKKLYDPFTEWQNSVSGKEPFSEMPPDNWTKRVTV